MKVILPEKLWDLKQRKVRLPVAGLPYIQKHFTGEHLLLRITATHICLFALVDRV